MNHKNARYKKYPVNACGVRDVLSGDMLAQYSLFLSQGNSLT